MLTLKIICGIIVYFVIVSLLSLTQYIKYIDFGMTLLLALMVIPTLRSASEVMMDTELSNRVILYKASYSAVTWWMYSFVFGYFVFRFYAPMVDLQFILN